MKTWIIDQSTTRRINQFFLVLIILILSEVAYLGYAGYKTFHPTIIRVPTNQTVPCPQEQSL